MEAEHWNMKQGMRCGWSAFADADVDKTNTMTVPASSFCINEKKFFCTFTT
jgi:hypothetical protein